MAGEAPIRPIFLLSLPRSGSTLVQRALATSPAVATTSEPWLLLPSFYALRRRGVCAEYGQSLLVDALEDVCAGLPGGRTEYLDAVRGFALDIYRRLAGPSAVFFLDKTPRYHLILDELFETFPDAKFVFLWRNPLAVAASISDAWDAGRWNPYRWNSELRRGLRRLVDAFERNQAGSLSVTYEDVVSDPTSTFRRIFDYLGLPFEPSCATTFSSVRLSGRLGDKSARSICDTISTDPVHHWRGAVAGRARRHWATNYLQWLGQDTLRVMGYDLEELTQQIRIDQRGHLSARDVAIVALGETVTRTRERRRKRASTHF